MSWWGKYVGVPFAERGFDTSGWHCWGLVHHVLLAECGVQLPKYGEISSSDLREIAVAMGEATASSSAGPWNRVEDPREFDVMVATGTPTSRRCGHVGVMVDAGHVLHVWRASHTVKMPIRHPLIARRILGFYRHEALA